MLRSLSSAVAGLRTHQTRMDVIGNNIANVNTYAFKTSSVTFKDTFYQNIKGSSQSDDLFSGSNAAQIGYGSNVANISRLDTVSSFASTGKATDCMIDGEGYFITGHSELDCDPDDQDGMSMFEYTRLGTFEFDSDGYLVDISGSNYVYGFQGDGTDVDESQLTRIMLPEDENIKNISVGTNGTITGVDEDGETLVLGRLAVAYVSNPAGLEASSGSKYKATVNSGNITAFTPGQGATGKVSSGGLEASNVDLSKEFTDMITTQRGFQANSRIITVSDTMLEELINLKR